MSITFNLAGCHLGDVLLALPYTREGDTIIVSQDRYKVDVAGITWTAKGVGIRPHYKPSGHITDAWKALTNRNPIRHILMPKAPRCGIVIAPDVAAIPKRWNKWDELYKKLPNAMILDGSFNRQQWMHALNTAEIVICPDTGTAHMADALGAKVIALYGNDATWTAYHPTWDYKWCIHKNSMDDITVDEVMHNVIAAGIKQ